MLAEKIATAIALGPANTRVRDYADIYTLTGVHDLSHAETRAALLATAGFRGTTLGPLSPVLDNLVTLRSTTYAAYRRSLGADAKRIPESFGDVVAAVLAFADPLSDPAPGGSRWLAGSRRWAFSTVS